MLDLDTGVDLDKVVAVLLVDQELCGSRISVVDRLGKLDSIVQEGIADLGGEVLGRGQLDNLLVPALDGAVTLVQVDDVSVVVAQELDLDVLGLVQETLDEDGSVAEGSLGLGRSPVEGVLQAGLVPHDTHTTPTASVGGLDDDGEAILISELLDLFESLDRSFGAGHDRDASLDGNGPGRDLVTEGIDDLGGGADELGS